MGDNSCAAFENLFAVEIKTLRSRQYLVKIERLAAPASLSASLEASGRV